MSFLTRIFIPRQRRLFRTLSTLSNCNDAHSRTHHRPRRSPLRFSYRRPRLCRRISRKLTERSQRTGQNLSDAYSRVQIVQNGDIVTLVDPDLSQDTATSAQSRRRMAPRISLPCQYQAPVTNVKDQGGYPICWAFGATSAVGSNVLRKTQGSAQPNGNSAGSATILPSGGISPNVSSTQPDYSEANLFTQYSTHTQEKRRVLSRLRWSRQRLQEIPRVQQRRQLRRNCGNTRRMVR